MNRVRRRRVVVKGRGDPSRQRGKQNGLERDYEERLQLRQLAGEVAEYRFEGAKFRLASGAWYTPDFLVVLADGLVELHEIKGGHWRDQARIRIKVAAREYPYFRFVAMTRPRGQDWQEEDFSP